MNASSDQLHFDWNELAFASKKPLSELNATFIAAPRELSSARFTQLVKTYLPQGNVILGLAKEPHVQELEDQPQFKMLGLETVAPIITKVAQASPTHKIYTLSYFQRDLKFVLEKVDFARAVFVNGSWYHAFHLRSEYYALVNHNTPHKLVSPFANEDEARTFAQTFANNHPASPPDPARSYTDTEMLETANQAARRSFAYSEHQIGVALGRRTGNRYRLLATTHNRVVPYETYAMHHGASRETHFSPMNDLNHYDVNHAEVELITKAARDHLELAGSTLFINVLPCPTCARMFTTTPIAEFVYTQDHSAGYALKMLEAAGKTVQRLIL